METILVLGGGARKNRIGSIYEGNRVSLFLEDSGKVAAVPSCANNQNFHISVLSKHMTSFFPPGVLRNVPTYSPELLPRKDDSEYVGEATLICPFAGPNTFHAMLGIRPNGDVLHNSNSFLTDSNFINNRKGLMEYDKHFTIFRRLAYTHTYLKTNPAEEVIEEEMFLLLNPFGASNIGHDLSILFDRINTYKMRGLTMPVVVGDVMKLFPAALEICNLLLPGTKLFFLPSDKIIHFKRLHIHKNVVFDITRHRSTIVRELIERCISETPADVLDSFKGQKIIIMKTDLNSQVVTSTTRFRCSNTIRTLERLHGFKYINPEVLPMKDVILYLQFASRIVTSFGAISYAHGIFFNPHIKFHFIKTEYDPYYDIDKYTVVKMPLDIDSVETRFITAIV
jgi:hypothetical protein